MQEDDATAASLSDGEIAGGVTTLHRSFATTDKESHWEPAELRNLIGRHFFEGPVLVLDHQPAAEGNATILVMSDVTQILSKIEAGDQVASEELLPLVYDSLRKLAAARMASERPGHTLQATALVHEAYLRLVDVEKAQKWNSLGHFYAAAAEAMRRVMVEKARKKKAQKRGGDWARIAFETARITTDEHADEVLSVNDLFDRFAEAHPDEAALAKLHYFAGYNISEAARSLGMPVSSAHLMWSFARAWFIREIGNSQES